MSNSNIFCLDCETTGLETIDSWIVQLAWQVYSPKADLLSEKNYIIKPFRDNFIMPEEAFKVHGISTEKVMREGKPFIEIFQEIQQDMKTCQTIIGHNVWFDLNFLFKNVEIYFNSDFKKFWEHVNDDFNIFCTMSDPRIVYFCQLPQKSKHWRNNHQYKDPKLQELHQKLFNNESFSGAHDALNDVKATAKCFFELVKLNVIKLPS
jgi:DNA polymerase III epsilon subunit-like protein